MSKTMTRRQWLAKSGTALSGAFLAGYGRFGKPFTFPGKAASASPVRIMFNENPYRPSKIARQAMVAAFDEGNLYSRRAYNELRELIAKQVDLPPEYILIGSGSREILQVAGLVCGLEGGELVQPHPTFEAIGNYAETIGARVHRVPIDASLHFDFDAIRRKITKNTKVVYLCNPNNPTGTITPAKILRPFCEEMAKKALVFVDEAYYEYVTDPQYQSMINLVREGHNVIVSRTASKIHGLAGLRVGFGFAKPDLIRHLQKRLTGTTNIIGLRAAIASYRDKEFQVYCRRQNEKSREIVYQVCKETRRRYVPSHTNFIFIHTGIPVQKFQKAMMQYGIQVGRPFPPYRDWCRVSMAKPEEMMKFAAAFRRIVNPPESN